LGCNVQACDTHGGGVWNEVKRCEDGRTVQPWRADA
jgi:hypothetical protein